MKTRLWVLSTAALLAVGANGCGKSASSEANTANGEAKDAKTEQQNALLGGGTTANPYGFSAGEFSFPVEGGSVAITADKAWDINLQAWLALYKADGTSCSVEYTCEIPQDTVLYAMCRDQKDLDELYLRSNLGALPVPGMSMGEFLKKYPEAHTFTVTLWKNPLKIDSFSCTVSDPVLYSKNNPVRGFVVRMQIDSWITLERKFFDWYEILGEVADSRLGADLKPAATYLQYRTRTEGNFKAVLTVSPNTTGKARSMKVPVGGADNLNEFFAVDQR